MFVADSKRLTHAGAKKIADTAVAKARQAGIAISVAVADAGGHLIVLERMDGGRFHSLHSRRPRPSAPPRASGPPPRTARRAGARCGPCPRLALAAGPGRWTAMEGGCPIFVEGECIGGVGVSGADWRPTSASRAKRSNPSALPRAQARSRPMAFEPLRVACIGMGWWSDVLADATRRSKKVKIVACYTRSEEKRRPSPPNTAARRRRATRRSWKIAQSRRSSTHAERRASGNHARRRRSGQARVSRQADCQYRLRRARDHRGMPQGRGRARPGIPAAPREPFPVDPRSDRRSAFGKLVNAEANISATGSERSISVLGATRRRGCRGA